MNEIASSGGCPPRNDKITEELINQAKKFIHPERKVVGLDQLINELKLSWREALDLRNELERRGLVVHKDLVGKRNN